MSLAEIRKTIAAALTGGGGALAVAAADGEMLAVEWWVVLAATLVTAASVWYTPNTPTPGPGRNPHHGQEIRQFRLRWRVGCG